MDRPRVPPPPSSDKESSRVWPLRRAFLIQCPHRSPAPHLGKAKTDLTERRKEGGGRGGRRGRERDEDGGGGGGGARREEEGGRGGGGGLRGGRRRRRGRCASDISLTVWASEVLGGRARPPPDGPPNVPSLPSVRLLGLFGLRARGFGLRGRGGAFFQLSFELFDLLLLFHNDLPCNCEGPLFPVALTDGFVF